MANDLNLEKIPLPVKEPVETSPSPERKLEKERDVEKETDGKDLSRKKISVSIPKTATKLSPDPNSYEQKRVQEIESIMSSGMDKIFLEMKAKDKLRFKNEGEKTALKINLILSKAKISADKIIDLIKNWLKLIPGVNRYFLEQEAKIKTDKILNIHKKL